MPEQQTIQEAVKQIPKPFILDASVLDMQETYEIIKEDIKQNRIEFQFPEGLNQVDLIEECRALTQLDDFDAMYDLTMQMLEGKPLLILIKNIDGTKTILASFQITDRYMNLRGEEAVNQYPVLVVWLTEFIGAYISKKFPLPSRNQPQAQEAGKKTGGRTKKPKGKATTT